MEFYLHIAIPSEAMGHPILPNSKAEIGWIQPCINKHQINASNIIPNLLDSSEIKHSNFSVISFARTSW